MTNGEVSGMKGSYHFFEFLKSPNKNAAMRAKVEENNSVEILFTVEFLSSFSLNEAEAFSSCHTLTFSTSWHEILDVLLEKMLKRM